MLKRVLLMLVTLTLVGGLAACSGASSAVTDQTPPEFAATVATPGVVTIDVRTPEEFAEGHLPGALNINAEGGTFDAEIAALDKGATYAIYCRSGRRSALAAERMADAGFTSLYTLDSGLLEWTEPLVTN